ncbi:MAG: hypothetical protein K1X36_13605 [Pyrinomonadaceae bacterium]|nr:hypothetical protein [Pyrinomonadaceae bacterium]
MKQTIFAITVTVLLAAAANAQGSCNALDANMGFANNALQSSLNNTWHIVTDDMQKLMFTPDVWKAELAKVMNCSPSAFPSNWMDRVRTNLEELRRLVDNEGKTRSWVARSFQRPTEQAMAKSKFLAKYPGAKVLKIGSNYKDWNVFKNSLGIPTNRYIRGEAVLQIPGRPYCQAQEWVVKQQYKGGGYGASVVEFPGGAGYFVTCQ